METPAAVHGTKLPLGRREFIWIALFCIAFGIFVLVAGSEMLSLPVHSYGAWFDVASAGLGVWLFLLIVAWARRTRRFDPFELPVWFSINIYVQVVMNIWLLQRDRISPIPWLSAGTPMMPLAVLLFGVALTALWAGYAITYRWITSRRASGSEVVERQVNVFNTSAIWLVTWLVGLYVAFSGLGGYLGEIVGNNLGWLNYVRFIAIIGSAATALLAIRHFRNPTLGGWVWLVLLVGAQIAQSLIAGSKGFALFLVWLVMYYFYARGRLPKRWVLVAGLLVILLVPVVNRYREELHVLDHGQGVSLENRLTALKNVFGGTVLQPVRSSFETTRATFEYRQGGMLDLTASALYLHPDRLYFVGTEMAEAFIPQVIPRVFWPGKPLTRSPLLMITTVYGGARTEHSLSALGLAADAYRAGGWVAVVVMFVLLGAFMAWLYVRGPLSGSLVGIVIYTTLLSSVILYDRDFSTLLVNLIQFGPLIWVIVRWVMFSSQRTNGSTPSVPLDGEGLQVG